MLKRIYVMAVPAAVLASALLFASQIPVFSPATQEMLQIIPYLALSLGLLLSLYFNRGRVVILFLLLGLTYWSLGAYLPTLNLDLATTGLLVVLLALLQFNIALLSFMKERGVLSPGGRMRLVFFLLQVIAVCWGANSGEMARITFTEPVVPRAFLSSLHGWHFFLPLASFLVTALIMWKRRAPIEAGFFGVALAIAMAFNEVGEGIALPLYFSAAGVILIISVLQDSHNMAFRDDLTSLPSRRSLNEQFMSLGKPYVIAMVDVDHFKRFNDTYGHDVGDQVLRMVAIKLDAVGGGGRAFRYGGEEFTIIFQRKKIEEVLPHLEDLRKAIAAYKLNLRGTDRPADSEEGKSYRTGQNGDKFVSVTVSIGVAANNDYLRTPEQVVKAADGALYKAKSRGRNQVCR
jgi:GGDEF domain-containing protein